MFKRILVSSDGSEHSRRAVRNALILAKGLGAEIIAVRVSVTPAHLVIGGVDLTALPDKVRQEIARQIAGDLAWIRQEAQSAGVACEALSIESEHPWRGIVDTARDKGCDLIAMASYGHHGMPGLLVGSETQKVLVHSTIPVLVYR